MPFAYRAGIVQRWTVEADRLRHATEVYAANPSERERRLVLGAWVVTTAVVPVIAPVLYYLLDLVPV